MSADAYFYVVLSAATHAYWNFLLKRSGGSQVFVGVSKAVEAGLLAAVLLIGTAWRLPFGLAFTAANWIWPVVGALLVLANYVLLAAAYRRGELSLVYPISRGAVLVFLPPLAFFTIGERLDPIGWLAIAIIVLGIALVQLASFSGDARRAWLRAARTPATLFALAAALTAAGYTVWDKQAVQRFQAFSYFAAYSVIVGGIYAAAFPVLWTREAIAGEWRTHRSAILQVAVLNSTSYLLALAALRTGKASYVIALRQLSIVVGALLGAWWLREAIPPPRRVGIALVVIGCVLLGLAR